MQRWTSRATGVLDHVIQTNRGNLFAREWTAEVSSRLDREPLVLLHDSLGCVEMWRDFPEKLCGMTGRKVIAYDRMGFGQSGAREDHLQVSFIKDEAEVFVPQVLKHFGIDKYIAFGHSVGGPMAINCAIQMKNCVGVITEAGQAFVGQETTDGIRVAKKSFEDPNVFQRLEKYHGPKARWVLDAWTETWLSPQFANWTLRDDIVNVTCPMLVLHGDKDEYGSVEHPKLINACTSGPCEVHILEQCGHVPHREKPEVVLDIICSFLDRDARL